jgi:hypothetical protein
VNPMFLWYDLPDDSLRHPGEERIRLHMQEARSLMPHGHSRGGLLARFLQRMADRIDPTGEARQDLR